jgi:hypothetical protein
MVDYSYCRDPEWLRADCPLCGRMMFSETVYVTDEAKGIGLGYLICWVCPGRDDRQAPCSYRRVL